MKGKHLLLDLASGNPAEGELQPVGYILQDIEPHPGISLVCDIVDLKKHIKNGQCKRIRASHCLEHFPTRQLPSIFSMIYDLLEPGGDVEVHVPNFRWHAQLISEGRDEEAVNYCFGGQRDKYDFHKTAFTPKILRARLSEAGFIIADLIEEHSLHCISYKPSVDIVVI